MQSRQSFEADSPESPTTARYRQLLREESDSSTSIKSGPAEIEDTSSATQAQGEALLYALRKVPIELSLSLLCSLRHGDSWEKVLEGLPSDSELQTMDTSNILHPTQEPPRGPNSRTGAPSTSESRTGTFHATARADPKSVSEFAFGGTALPQAFLDSSPWIIPMFDRQGYLCGQYLSVPGLRPSTYPSTADEVQRMDFSSPTWDMPPQSRTSDPNDPFWTLFHEALTDIRAGHSIDQVCGTHAWMSALYDEVTYLRAPKLTQLVVRLVKGMKPHETGPTLTSCAMTWIYWTLFRWMLDPSPDTFAEIPEVARPTSWQTSATHTFMVDTVLSPTLRDHLCESQSTDMRWCTSAWTTVQCDWNWSGLDLLCRDDRTGELDLSPISTLR